MDILIRMKEYRTLFDIRKSVWKWHIIRKERMLTSHHNRRKKEKREKENNNDI